MSQDLEEGLLQVYGRLHVCGSLVERGECTFELREDLEAAPVDKLS
jgi:hypothetical protein